MAANTGYFVAGTSPNYGVSSPFRLDRNGRESTTIYYDSSDRIFYFISMPVHTLSAHGVRPRFASSPTRMLFSGLRRRQGASQMSSSGQLRGRVELQGAIAGECSFRMHSARSYDRLLDKLPTIPLSSSTHSSLSLNAAWAVRASILSTKLAAGRTHSNSTTIPSKSSPLVCCAVRPPCQSAGLGCSHPAICFSTFGHRHTPTCSPASCWKTPSWVQLLS